jgi:hypothetical protein
MVRQIASKRERKMIIRAVTENEAFFCLDNRVAALHPGVANPQRRVDLISIF